MKQLLVPYLNSTQNIFQYQPYLLKCNLNIFVPLPDII